MKQIVPFLHFDGNCREAMEFYKQVLGADLFIMPSREAPGDPDLGHAGVPRPDHALRAQARRRPYS